MEKRNWIKRSKTISFGAGSFGRARQSSILDHNLWGECKSSSFHSSWTCKITIWLSSSDSLVVWITLVKPLLTDTLDVISWQLGSNTCHKEHLNPGGSVSAPRLSGQTTICHCLSVPNPINGSSHLNWLHQKSFSRHLEWQVGWVRSVKDSPSSPLSSVNLWTLYSLGCTH